MVVNIATLLVRVVLMRSSFLTNRCTYCSLNQPKSGLKGRFRLWPKVERLSISINHIARNQEFGLLTIHIKAKVQRPSQFTMTAF
jgi:hypothetical protein